VRQPALFDLPVKRQPNRTPDGGLGCAFGRPWPVDPEWHGPHHCRECAAEVERLCGEKGNR
jgi:hypothetical protein